MNDVTALWYLVHCKPREDARALENLERQGFFCYRPVQRVERWRHGRKCIVSAALFPRYLFVRLDSVTDNWSAVRSTRGVQQIVRFNEYPVPVADAIIEALRSRIDRQQEVEPYLRQGDRVVITEKPFAQLEAIFVAHNGQERVLLLLNMLQKEQQLSFPLTSVRKIG